MDCFAWNIRGANCNVCAMLKLAQPQLVLMYYKRTCACYIGGPTTNGTVA